MRRTIRSASKCTMVLVALTATLATIVQIVNVRPAHAGDNYPWDSATCIDGTDCSQTYNWGYSLPCPQVDPSCTTYEYPNAQSPTAGMGDNWGYGVRNCTSYAAWKVNQVFGANISGWGQAYQWSSNAPSSDVHATSGYTPQVGDIAQWNATGSNPYGHVAYVYAVNGTTASLGEYNSGYPKANGSFQWGLYYDGFTSADYPVGGPNYYIHIGGTPQGSGVGTATYLGTNELQVNQQLSQNQYIESPDGEFVLEMQPDGNLVEYGPGYHAIWSSGTSNTNPVMDYAVLQPDGNFVEYDATGTTSLWSNNHPNSGSNNYVVLQPDGNLVEYLSDRTTVVWSNGAAPANYTPPAYKGSDELQINVGLYENQYIRSADGTHFVLFQPNGIGAVYGPAFHVIGSFGYSNNGGGYLVLQSDGNFVEYLADGLTSVWSNQKGGSGGTYMVIQNDGNFVEYLPDRITSVWSTNTGGLI